MSEWDHGFEKEGAEVVRLKLESHGYASQIRDAAIVWLGNHDRERFLRSEASQSEQIELARKANAIASDAKAAAIIAAIMAAISILLTLLIWYSSYHSSVNTANSTQNEKSPSSDGADAPDAKPET